MLAGGPKRDPDGVLMHYSEVVAQSAIDARFELGVAISGHFYDF